MFEITVDTLAVDAGVPDAELLTAGEAKPEVHVQVIGGQTLPFQQPGTDRPLRIPGVAINFGLTKDAALKLADLIKTQAETLPDAKAPSGIVTASSLSDVERTAEAHRKLHG